METAVIESVGKTKTRAQVLRDRVCIRLAVDAAGPKIAELLKMNGIELPGSAWDKVWPHWLIATMEDEVIGCVMVLPAKPFGFLEFLFVKPSASPKMRAIALHKLTEQGVITLAIYGASYLFGTVETENAVFRDVLKKNHLTQVATGTVMARRLRN